MKNCAKKIGYIIIIIFQVAKSTADSNKFRKLKCKSIMDSRSIGCARKVLSYWITSLQLEVRIRTVSHFNIKTIEILCHAFCLDCSRKCKRLPYTAVVNDKGGKKIRSHTTPKALTTKKQTTLKQKVRELPRFS